MGAEERRRALAGRTGCGGVALNSLTISVSPSRRCHFTQTFNLGNLDKALEHLNDVQPIGQLSGCHMLRRGCSRRARSSEVMKMWAATGAG